MGSRKLNFSIRCIDWLNDREPALRTDAYLRAHRQTAPVAGANRQLKAQYEPNSNFIFHSFSN